MNELVIKLCSNGPHATVWEAGLCQPCYKHQWNLTTTAPVKHASVSGYARGCRCSKCKAAKSASNRANYLSKRAAQ